MSHTHEHSHEPSTYYMEQLCTIGVCGVLGIVAVLAYYQKFLEATDPPLLAPYLHRYVLWSGFAILGLVGYRGVSLWLSVGRLSAAHENDLHHDENRSHHHDHHDDHDDDHDHSEHEHHHDHDECHHHENEEENGHDHGHDHGWNPWRYTFLCLPIILFFLGLPNEGFKSVKAMEVEESDRAVSDKSGKVVALNFKDLETWANDDSQREFYEGQTGTLKGQFVPKSPTTFGLVRFKMTCCAADAIPLNVVIISPEAVADIKAMSWVQVTGQIQFRKRKNREEYIPVLKLRSRNDIKETTRDEDPYL